METVRPDELLHLAWYTNPSLYWSSSENHRWVTATTALVRAFLAHGRRLVVAGTSAEYDWKSAGKPFAEDSAVTGGTGVYGTCKDATRAAVSSLTLSSGASMAWGRVFAVYGPGEPEAKLVSTAARTFRQGQTLRMPKQPLVRDYIFVDDVARAFLQILDSDLTGPVNIGTGIPVTVQEVAAEVGRALDVPFRIEAVDARGDEAPMVVADSTRIRGLGWAPATTLTEGILATIAALPPLSPQSSRA
jgi:nucleoside-diphosphate-sugar epimerase